MNDQAGKIVFAGLGLVWFASAAIVNAELLPNNFSAVALPKASEIFDGKAAATFEAQYRNDLFFNDASRTLFGTVRYVAFHEGRHGVVVGNDGWLFTSEELERPDDYQSRIAAGFERIKEVKERLDQHGVTLTVALIPQKTDIYSDKLTAKEAASIQSVDYEATRARIAALGVTAPDLREPLLAARRTAPIFLRTDTHWTPFGAQVAAMAIGEEAGIAADATKTLVETAAISVSGDLKKYLSLGSFAESAGYPIETVRPLAVPLYANLASTDIFSDTQPSIVLVGTSYSANENWSFAESLKYAFGQDILNMAEQGKGPFLPMANYIETLQTSASPPQQVIWEIPLRYFVATKLAPEPHVPQTTATHSDLSAALTKEE
jgi:alginate O-acetyltransferase complex protein AlgJ